MSADEQALAAPQRGITVSGQGSVSVATDTAEATLGVQIESADLAAAQREAARLMGDVQDALLAAGVPQAKIQTVNYSVAINRDDQNSKHPITGYIVTDLVRISVTPVGRLGSVLQAAANAGANQVQWVGFTVADTTAAAQQARQQAMADAHAKAEQLAQLAGVTLGQPLSISEGGLGPPSEPASGAFRAYSLKAGAMIPAPPMQGGETTIAVSVTVRYAF